MQKEKIKMTREEAIVYFFVRAWQDWERAFTIDDWMEQSFAFNRAEINLYQALGFAGLSYLMNRYKLPRKKK